MTFIFRFPSLKTHFTAISTKSNHKRSWRKASRQRSLRLEMLEDRLAPATLTVNTTADVVNPSDGTLSLRDAISAVNAGNANGLTAGEMNQVSGTFGVNDTIVFSSMLSGDTITLNGSALEISANLTITGLGADNLTISGNNQSGVFTIDAGAQANLTGLTICNGQAAGSGGGIANSGTLTVSNSVFSDNSCSTNAYGFGGEGGGIANDYTGTLTVGNCTFSGNSAANYGGGIANETGTVTVSNCTLSDNSTSGHGGGGGIYNDDGGTLTVSATSLVDNTVANFGVGGGAFNEGTLTVSSSTLWDNTANYIGGGIFNDGTLTVTNATLADNTANNTGGGIFNDGVLTVTNATLADNAANNIGGGIAVEGGSATLNNTLVANNSSGGDLFVAGQGTVLSGSYDLIGNGSYLSQLPFSIAGNPLLSSLGNYGGPTQTFALLPGSPAIDAGSNSLAVDATGNPLTTDQRGQPRIVGSAVDIGAFESQGFTIAATSGSNQTGITNTAFAAPLVVTVTANNNLEPVNGGVVTFTGASSGASAVVSTTNAILNGDSISVTATANNAAGSYTITADAAGINTPASFLLSNIGPPASIAASGGGQDTTVNTAFAAPLVATVTDAYGNPVPGITVIFAGPGSGANVTFPDGSTAITNAQGQVSVLVDANTIAGSYTVSASVSGVSSPASFELTNQPGTPIAIAATSGGGQDATVNTAFTAPLVATVTDVYGNPVPGVTVTFADPGNGADVDFPDANTALTNAQGQASLVVGANNSAGSYTVSASISGVSTPASFDLTNLASTPAVVTATSGSGQYMTVTTAFAALVATVTDAYRNPLSGVTVTFTGTGSGADVTFPDGNTATTNAQGQASLLVDANTIAGTYTVNASVSGVSTPAGFELTNEPGTPATVAVASGGGQDTTVNTAFAAPLVAIVTDAYGNAVPNVTVQFTGTGSGADVTFPDGNTAVTNAQGQASVPVDANTVAGSYSVSASVSGVSSPTSFNLTNAPGAPAAIASVSGSGQNTTVNTAFTAPLVTMVTDAYGNAVPNVTVLFTGIGSGADVTFPDGSTATTNAQGQASIPVDANTIAGSDTVSASVSGVSGPAGFELTNAPGTPATVASTSGGGQNATVNTAFAAPLVATVDDAYGNAVPGITVTFASPGSGANVTFPDGNTATTNAQGQASVPVNANTVAGSYSVSASVSGVSSPAGFDLTNEPGMPAAIAAAGGGGQDTTVNTAFAAPLVAIVTDAYGNAVPNVTVQFTGTSSGADVTFPDGNTAVTNAQGQASVPVDANTIAGSDTVSASVSGVSSPTNFNLTNAPGTPTTVAAASGGGQDTTVNTAFAVPLVTTVTDAYGNSVPGVTVTFTGTGSGANVTFPDGNTAVTNGQGQASLLVDANTIAGSDTVSASVSGVSSPASFELTNEPGMPATVAVASGSGQDTTVNTSFAAPLVAIVTDAYGNAVPNVTVQFTGAGSGADVTFPDGDTAVTNAQGQAIVPVDANTIAGSDTVSASVSGVSSPTNFDLTNAPGAPAAIAAASGGGQDTTVNTAFAAPLVTTVTDAYGNPVPGVIVTFAGPGSGANVTFPDGNTAITNAQGQASVVTDANTSAGSFTVTASVSGVGTVAHFNLTNDPGAAATITTLSGDSQSAPVNTAFAAPLVAKVTDQYGNAVSGATVVFAGPGSGAGVTFPSGSTVTTDAQGQASLNAGANTHAGSYTATASVSGVSIEADFALTNNPGAPTAIAVTSGSGQTTTVNTAFAAPLVATVTDAYGNLVPDVSVTFVSPSGAGVTFAGDNTVRTNAQGQASIDVSATTSAGSYSVAASVSGVSTPADFSLTNKAGAPAAITMVSGSPQSAVVNTAFAVPLVVQVTDLYGNLVNGVAVTFAAPGQGASVTFLAGATATTNAQGEAGQASLPVGANSSAGSYTITASVAGVSAAASFDLSNNPGAPAAITVVSGGGQSALISTPFAAPLVAMVTDAFGNPISGTAVTFTSSVSGAGVTFPSGSTATTNAQGQASVLVDANSSAGSYTVATSVSGVSTVASFGLTNTAPPVITPISPQTVLDGSTLSVPITATSANGSPTFSLGTGAPAFASINATTGLVTLTPSEWNGITPGTYALTVVATNEPQLVSTATFSVTVGPSSTDQGSGATAQDNINMRTAVAAGIDNSQEYYTDLLDADYLKYVNRLPTQAELTSFWYPNLPIPGQASAGADFTDQEIEAYFIGSPEYIQDNGGTDQGWIAGMYQSILGRPAQPSEITYWLNQKQADLNSGMSVGDADIAVAKGIVASNASESILVGADYTRYLGRSGSATEIAYWVNLFETGYTNEQVIAGFVGSQEFFQDHGSNIVDWLFADYKATLNRLPDLNGFNYWENQL